MNILYALVWYLNYLVLNVKFNKEAINVIECHQKHNVIIHIYNISPSL